MKLYRIFADKKPADSALQSKRAFAPRAGSATFFLPASLSVNNIKALRKSGVLRLRIGDWRILNAIDSESGTMTVISILPCGRAHR